MQTVKSLADELHLSKVAINKRLESLGVKDRLVKDGNRNLIPDDVCDLVRESYKNRRTEPTRKTAPTSEPPGDVLQVLSDQLAEKDRQIAELMAQLKSLQNQQAELIKSVQQSTYLLADSMGVTESRDMNVEVDAETVQPGSENHSDRNAQEDGHKSLFGRLFR